MTCREIRYQLPDFVQGTLGDEPSEAVRAHVAGCPLCRLEVEQLNALFAQLGELKVVVPPSPAYWASVLPRVHEAGGKRRSLLWLGRIQPAALPLAAAMALALFLLEMSPFKADVSSVDLQSTISQFKADELQEVNQQQVSVGMVEPVGQDEPTLTSDADTDVLQDLLSEERDHAAVTDIDHETLLQALNEQDAVDLVSLLEQKGID